MKRLSLFLSLVTFVFLVGCSDSSSKEESTEPVVKEEKNTSESKTETVTSIPAEEDLAQSFTNYLDEITVLAPEEERIIGLYDSVTGVNYTNDEILYFTLLDEIIPGYRQFVIDLEAIMPENEQIRELHELYIEAANIQYNSFTLMTFALEEQNIDKMTEANEGLDQARKLLRDWLYEVEAFSKETGVSLE